MFSRSRNTAMVASEVVVGMGRFYARGARRLRLKPVVVEAHADPLLIDGVGRHLVAQPALEQHQMPATAGTVIQARFDGRAFAVRGGAAMKRSRRGSSNLIPGTPLGTCT